MEDLVLKKSFLKSMRGIASTVGVISAKSDEERHAMTATSFNSLSMDPPTMLVCVNKEAGIHSILAKDSFFCINILSNSQKELADICSISEEGEARFLNDNWKEKEDFIYAPESLSNILCECTELVQYSSHTIFIGEVLNVMTNETLDPLMYGSGKYLNEMK